MADSAEFKKVADDVRNLAKRPTDAEFADMYSLFKQATAGDCNIAKPSITDILGHAKYEAWNKRKGLSRDEAAKQYIETGKKAVQKYGVK